MRVLQIGCSVAAVLLTVGSAYAGGFSRGTADTDILYEDGNFNMRAGTVVVLPGQNVAATPAATPNASLVGTNYLDSYTIPSAAVKFAVTDGLSCAGTYTQSNGASSSFGHPFGPGGTLSENFATDEFGATCAYFLDVGRGRLALLAGGFIERFGYDLSARPVLLGGNLLDLSLDGSGYGWRAGIGYEIPDIAFRAQLLYRSGVGHDVSGSAVGPWGVLPATASGELPQSLEMKLQSGIAPGWLAFGSVKWTDWSVNERFIVDVSGLLTAENQYLWRDSWTVTAGIGHVFTPGISGAVSLQWDRGVSTGYDFRTEKWLLAGGVSLADSHGGELRLGGGVSYLTSAEIDRPDAANFGAAVDAGWAGVVTASYSVRW